MHGFVCIAREKKLELGADKELHRAEQLAQTKSELAAIQATASRRSDTTIKSEFLPGGGIDYDECEDIEVDVSGDLLAVFRGHLTNHAYLVKKYCLEEAGLEHNSNIPLAKLKQQCALSQAGLLCALYRKFSSDLLPKLRGKFAFCIYDSHLVRVLAARDKSGTYDLQQGHLKDSHSLVISSGFDIEQHCSDMEEIPPSHFKYGWRSAARPFHSDQHQGSRSSMDSNRSSMDSGRRWSMDARRQSFDTAHRRSCDMRRRSTDAARVSRASTLYVSSAQADHLENGVADTERKLQEHHLNADAPEFVPGPRSAPSGASSASLEAAAA